MLGWKIKKIKRFFSLGAYQEQKVFQAEFKIFIEFYCELENTTLIKKTECNSTSAQVPV